MRSLLDFAPWHCWRQGHGWLSCLRSRLASEREDLIAQGVDPSELAVPLYPEEE